MVWALTPAVGGFAIYVEDVMAFHLGDRVAVPGHDLKWYLVGEVCERPRFGRERADWVWCRWGDQLPVAVHRDMLVKLPQKHGDHNFGAIGFDEGVPRCGTCKVNLFRTLSNGHQLPEPVLRARAL